MKLVYVCDYNGVTIERNEETGTYYLISPASGVQKLFKNMEYAKNFIDNAEVLESNARALARNPW